MKVKQIKDNSMVLNLGHCKDNDTNDNNKNAERENTLEGINSRVMVSERPLGTFKSFYTEKNTQYLHPLMFTLRLSGSSALPAYPGFMVMKTAQVGFRESSVPSKMNIFSFRIMAC